MIVSLTLRELLYIDDCLTVSNADSKDQEASVLLEDRQESLRPVSASAKVSAPQDLVEKIIRVVHEGLTAEIGESKEYEIDIDEFDLLVLRELAQSDVVIEDEFVGLSLKRKLYKAWLDFKAFGQDSEDITEEFEETSEGKDLRIEDVDMDVFKKKYGGGR